MSGEEYAAQSARSSHHKEKDVANQIQTGSCQVCGQEQYHTSADTCGGCGCEYFPPHPPAVPPIPDLIVTRHRGAVEWLCGQMPPAKAGNWWARDGNGDLSLWRYMTTEECDASAVADGNVNEDGSPQQWPHSPTIDLTVPVVAEVTPDDVRGKRVVGNLPLHLAALCASVTAIEFAGAAPRGQEYTAEDMTRAGARLTAYTVKAVKAV